MKSDYGKWFVSKDGRYPAIKCNREKLIDCLKAVYGSQKASQIHPYFRKATFEEHCRLELDLMED